MNWENTNTWAKNIDWRDVNLLNERREVEELLKGNRLNKNHVYRSCMVLAKYFYEQGVKHEDCAKKIFEWGSNCGVTISDNVTSIVNKVYRDDLKLEEKTLYISQK